MDFLSRSPWDDFKIHPQNMLVKPRWKGCLGLLRSFVSAPLLIGAEFAVGT